MTFASSFPLDVMAARTALLRTSMGVRPHACAPISPYITACSAINSLGGCPRCCSRLNTGTRISCSQSTCLDTARLNPLIRWVSNTMSTRITDLPALRMKVVSFPLADIGEGIAEVEILEWLA